MNYDKVYRFLAEDAWRMITDECKEKMISLKDPYIESLTEDIKYFTDKIKDDYAIDFADWLKKSGFFIELMKGSKSTSKILEIYKKEKGL